MKLTSRSFMAGAIKKHEGELSLRKEDSGNWFDPARFKAGLPQIRHAGRLVGSKYGVTAYALAAYRHDNDIEAWEMASLTLDEAIDIAEYLYVKAPRLNLLPWDRVTASIVDKGWGSGPAQAIKLWQRVIGAVDDGKIGPGTIAKDAAFRKAHSEEQAAGIWASQRIAFDTLIATNEGPKDPDRIFLNGWINRTKSFLPGTLWWKNA